jgi:uncharacterized protein YdaU (DUF1376 family)
MSKSNKVEQWMPLYIADYLADTTRLTTEQHGAYFLLILDYWRNGPPPDIDATLAQITKLTPAKWRAMRPILVEKFKVESGRWKHKRVERELGKAREMQSTLSERGRAGAAARWGGNDDPSGSSGNASGNASGNGPSNATGNASGMQRAMPEGMPETMLADAPSPSPTQEVPSPPPAPAPATRAGEIAVLLRKLATDRGKTVRIASIEKKVIAWAEKGISDQQLTAAFELAVQDREAKHETSAITPGFIDVFLGKLLNPNDGASRVNGRPKPWFIDNWPAIVAKGVEKGLSETKFDSAPAFRAAVLKAHGITAADVAKAEADYR